MIRLGKLKNYFVGYIQEISYWAEGLSPQY